MKAAIFGARAAFKRSRADRCRSRPRSRSTPAGDAARHRHRGRADHARGARRRRDRPELLDRPGAHARARSATWARPPLPISCIPNAGLPLQGPTARRSTRWSPEPTGRDAGRVRRALRRGHRRRLLRHDARSTSRALVERVGGASRRRAPERGRRGVSSAMPRRRPAPGARARRSSASGSTRRARRKVKRCCWPTTTTACVQVAREQVEGGAHVLDVCVALTERGDEADQMRDVVKQLRAGRRGAAGRSTRTEADVIEAALEQYPGRAIINSINLENGREQLDACAARDGARRRGRRADDRRGRAWPRPPSASSRSRAHPRHLRAASTASPRGADLRRAHLHAHHRRGGVARRRAIETIEGIRRSSGAARRADVLGVSNVSFGVAPQRARRAQLGLPVPLRRGRARPGDRQPGPHHALRRDRRERARAGRGPDLQPPRGRAAALHRPLRGAGRGAERERHGRPDRGHGARARRIH